MRKKEIFVVVKYTDSSDKDTNDPVWKDFCFIPPFFIYLLNKNDLNVYNGKVVHNV